MEFINNKVFDNYVDSYKKLSLIDKKNLVIEEIYKLLSLLENINVTPGEEYKVLFNREILDMKKEDATDEDFVEAMFVYVHIIEEMLADYIDKTSKETLIIKTR